MSEPEVTFRKIAHAIPEFIGNRRLFSNYECDVCNDKFSMSVENHFANYIAPWRTLTLIRGKKGIPTLKNEKDGWRIGSTNGEIRVDHREDQPIVTRDEQNNKITITAPRGHYFPRAVYKCLVKMALSIVPEEEMVNFKQTIAWVNNEDLSNDFTGINKMLAFFAMRPGPIETPITNILFRRKKDQPIDVPYMQYVVMFKNLMFQICIPLCKEDTSLAGKSVTIKHFPLPISEYGEPQYELLDLTSVSLIMNDSINISFNYDHVDVMNHDTENVE